MIRALAAAWATDTRTADRIRAMQAEPPVLPRPAAVPDLERVMRAAVELREWAERAQAVTVRPGVRSERREEAA